MHEDVRIVFIEGVVREASGSGSEPTGLEARGGPMCRGAVRPVMERSTTPSHRAPDECGGTLDVAAFNGISRPDRVPGSPRHADHRVRRSWRYSRS